MRKLVDNFFVKWFNLCYHFNDNMSKIKIAIPAIGGFIILSLLGLGLIGYYEEREPAFVPLSGTSAGKPEIKVTSFIGKIVEINENKIKIQVSTQQNAGIEEDNMILAVLTNNQTKFIEKDEILETKKDISFSDLKLDDQIIAIASENIAWQKEIMAQNVLRIKISAAE